MLINIYNFNVLNKKYVYSFGILVKNKTMYLISIEMKSILNLLCYLRVTQFNIVTNINLNVELHITSLVCKRATFLQKTNVYISKV